LRCVDDAISAEVDQRIDVVGGDDPRRFVQPTELRSISSDLLGTSGMHPDQF
jgi:hypothetical protein